MSQRGLKEETDRRISDAGVEVEEKWCGGGGEMVWRWRSDDVEVVEVPLFRLCVATL